MYLTETKSLITLALRDVFDVSYPVEDFAPVHVGIEFPDEPEHYPGIWVDFDPTEKLQIAGVAHVEVDEELHPMTRWRFAGLASYTVVALTSLERDRLFDELVKVFAFGSQTPQRSGFRQMIESNDLIAVNFNFDEITQSGAAASQGTPWGTDEFVYEITASMGCVGEFISDPDNQALFPLSAIVTYPYSDQEEDPQPGTGWR